MFIFSSSLIDFMTSGPVVAFELMGQGAIAKWRDLLGPTDSSVARSDAPLSIRARFGTGEIKRELNVNAYKFIGPNFIFLVIDLVSISLSKWRKNTSLYIQNKNRIYHKSLFLFVQTKSAHITFLIFIHSQHIIIIFSLGKI